MDDMSCWIEGIVQFENGVAKVNFEGNATMLPGKPIQSIEQFLADWLEANNEPLLNGDFIRVTLERVDP